MECLPKSQMRAKMIEGNDRATRFYTGLPTFVVFVALFEYLQGKASRMRLWRGPKAEEHRKPDRRGGGGRTGGRRLDLVDEFFMTHIRLRLGLFSEDIAQRFGISVSYFGKIFSTWVVFLTKELSLLFPFPSPEKVKCTPHASFLITQTHALLLIVLSSSLKGPHFQKQTVQHFQTTKIIIHLNV